MKTPTFKWLNDLQLINDLLTDDQGKIILQGQLENGNYRAIHLTNKGQVIQSFEASGHTLALSKAAAKILTTDQLAILLRKINAV